jgi:hypothetical protein
MSSSSIKDILYASFIQTIRTHVAPHTINSLNRKGIQFSVVNTNTSSNFVQGNQPFGSTTAANNSLYTPSAAKTTARKKEIKCDKAQYEEDKCWYHTRSDPPKRCENIRFDDYLCENCLTNKVTAKGVVRKMFPQAYPQGNGSGSSQQNMGGAAPATPFAQVTKGSSSRQVAPANFQGHKSIGVGQPFVNQQQQQVVENVAAIKTVDSIQVGNKTYYDQKHNLVFYGDQTEGYNCVGRLEEGSNMVCGLEQDEIEMCFNMGLNPLTDHELVGTIISTQPVAQNQMTNRASTLSQRSSLSRGASVAQAPVQAPAPATTRPQPIMRAGAGAGPRPSGGSSFSSVGMSTPRGMTSVASSSAISSSSSSDSSLGSEKQHFSSAGPTTGSHFSAGPANPQSSVPQSSPLQRVTSQPSAAVRFSGRSQTQTQAQTSSSSAVSANAPVSSLVRRSRAQTATGANPVTSPLPSSSTSNPVAQTAVTKQQEQKQESQQSQEVEESQDDEQQDEQQQDNFVAMDKDYSETVSDNEEEVGSDNENEEDA